jgi:DNA-binding CsgD family transcriptional regulator
LCGAASAVIDHVGSSLNAGGQFSFERAEAAARVKIGEAGFIDAWNEGQALTLEEAIALAVDAPGDEPLPPEAAAEYAVLSPREREVLALLAEGRSNQQIAAALFVSPRTVSNHVASILAKLDVPTRAAAAAFAARHGLA